MSDYLAGVGSQGWPRGSVRVEMGNCPDFPVFPGGGDVRGAGRKDVVFGAARVYTVPVPGPKRQSWLRPCPRYPSFLNEFVHRDELYNVFRQFTQKILVVIAA